MREKTSKIDLKLFLQKLGQFCENHIFWASTEWVFEGLNAENGQIQKKNT